MRLEHLLSGATLPPKAAALQVAVALLILNQVSLLPFFLYRKFVKPIERSPGIGITVL